MKPALCLAALALLGGCRARPVAEHIVYTVGPAYQAGGVWRYPAEAFAADQTGLATVYGKHPPRLTADGEVFDDTALAAAHPTLQLPAIARVTDLETGRQIVLRINDRGPASPARILVLTHRAALLLGAATEPVRVHVEVLEAESRQLAESLHGGPSIQIATAPRAIVRSDDLAPPPGVRQSAQAGAGAPALAATQDAPAAPVPRRMPEFVTQTAPDPGALWIEASSFGRAEYAERQRAELGLPEAIVERTRIGRQTTYRVRAGPYADPAQADAALDQAIKAGVTDARIVVE